MKALISKRCGGSLATSIAASGGILALLTLAGCSLPAVGPDYRRPDTPVATAYNNVSEQPPVAPGNRVTEMNEDNSGRYSVIAIA